MTLAYIDSFAGLVPCKVIGWDDQELMVQVTATRETYKRGEELTRSPGFIVPRPAVIRRAHQYRIRSFHWYGDPPQFTINY